MSNIDDIWASMNEESSKAVNKKVTAKAKVKTKPKPTKKHSNEEASISEKSKDKKSVNFDEMKALLARDLNGCAEEDSMIRRRALVNIYKKLFTEYTMSSSDYSDLFRDTSFCKPVFKRFADPIEKCRELSLKISSEFFGNTTDLVPVLGYFFPALLQRIPSGMGYDDDLKLFVSDLEQHEAYKRGKAVDRQDKVGTIGSMTHQIVEPSEEIRLLGCNCLFTLIKRISDIRAHPVLHPYFQEIILFLQYQLRDPYPDLKICACEALEFLAKTEEFEQGMKFFSVGLSRAILPQCRHRLSKVRVAAVTALHFCMIVPDRAKRKAAGSDAIMDLVGFREENVLQISAFYKPDVLINYLAELVVDNNVTVRERLALFLEVLLTEIGDRYDHHTRLLPYLLDLLTDEVPAVSSVALRCLGKCGKEYEDEHQDEVRERRQYGVDGDERINFDKPLPPPFLERPRIGVRLYIRGNSKRFLNALVNELTNWVSTTRLKSVELMKVVIVLCEEHLTMEAHSLFPAFIKALRFSRDDGDHDLHKRLLDLFELLGRYIAPEVYIHYILPRLRGDVEVVMWGVDAEMRVVVMEFLQSLISGSKPSLLPPHFDELISVLTDHFVIDPDSKKLQTKALEVLTTIFKTLHGKGHTIIEAHYLSTGRLTSMHQTMGKALKCLLVTVSKEEHILTATESLLALAMLDSNFSIKSANNRVTSSSERENFIENYSIKPQDQQHPLITLFRQYGAKLLETCLEEYELDPDWTVGLPEHQLLCRLVECPLFFVQLDPKALFTVLIFLCAKMEEVFKSDIDVETSNQLMLSFADVLITTLQPLYCEKFQIIGDSAPVQRALYGHGHNASSKGGEEVLYQEGMCVGSEEGKSKERVETLQVSREVVKGVLEKLVCYFIVPSQWSRSTELQTTRLRVVAFLSGLSDVEAHFKYELSSTQNECALREKEYLLKFISPIFDKILPTLFLPTNHTAVRAQGMCVARHLLGRLTDFIDQKSVKSFAYREANQGDDDLKSLTCKLKAQVALHYLLLELDDGDDAIRQLCLSTLSESTCLILSHKEYKEVTALQEEGSTGTNGTDRNKELSTIVQQLMEEITAGTLHLVSYDEMVRALLKQLMVETHATSFLDQLDLTLRTVCVLDPTGFERLVRAQAEEFDPISRTEQYNETISGLINHVDILNQFST